MYDHPVGLADHSVTDHRREGPASPQGLCTEQDAARVPVQPVADRGPVSGIRHCRRSFPVRPGAPGPDIPGSGLPLPFHDGCCILRSGIPCSASSDLLPQISAQPFIHGEVPGGCLLGQNAGRFPHDEDIFILIQDRLRPQQGADPAQGPVFLLDRPAQLRPVRRRSEIADRLVGQIEGDDVSRLHSLAAVRLSSPELDILFPEHFIKEGGRCKRKLSV